LSNGPTRAMIMAAGLGTRMRPLTSDLPKPLVTVAGKALIDHVMDRLMKAGVKTFVVNVHYRAEKLKAHLAQRKDAEIIISDETDSIMDSGGGVAKALAYFRGEPFFHANSDTLWVEGTRPALERLKLRWNEREMDALMLLAPTVNTVCYDGRGDFMMDADGRISRVGEQRIAPFVWSGVEILHPRLFEGAPSGKFSINPLWDRAIQKGRLFGVRLDGVWMHIDRPSAITEAEHYLADLARSR